MLARVAENLFWISRYVERAEFAVRLLDWAYHRELDAPLVGGAAGRRPLAAVARLLGVPDPTDGREVLLDRLAFDPSSPHSIRAMIARARENARGSQEAVSAEAWSQLNQLHLYLSGPRARPRLQTSPFRFFDRVRRACVLFVALVDGTIPRAEVYYFLQLGRSLERADLTARVVQTGLADDAPDADPIAWEGLLRVCSAHEAYVQRYQERVEFEGVISVLVLSADFPRSVRFRIGRCLGALRVLGGGPDVGPAGGTPAERLLGRLDGELHYTDAAEVCARGADTFLSGIVETCAQTAKEIQVTYFLTELPLTMLLRIDHETRLTYSEPVAESVITLRMAPSSGDEQTVLYYRLRATPPAPVTSIRDGFGNRVDLFNVLALHSELAIVATSFVQTYRRSGTDRLAGVPYPTCPPTDVEACEFLRPSPLVGSEPPVAAFVAALPRPTGPLVDGIRTLVEAVRGQLTYEKRVTTAHTPVAQALTLGRGVCQDFAHLLIAACRGVGLPARYVSGYVNHPGELATHAWVQVWGGPAAGWVDVDPTHDTWPAEDHVVTAVGRDYADVPPNRGVWKGTAAETIAVTVTVRPLDRLPPEAGEPVGAPAWVATAPAPAVARGRFQQQGRGKMMRQQQSQQQQTAGRW